MSLSQDQENAVKVFGQFVTDSRESIMIVRGHSGSGKTFLIKEFKKAAEKQSKLLTMLTGEDNKIQYLFTASTNKAANVIKNSLDKNDYTTTIHSALGLKVVKDFKKGTTFLRKTNNYQPVSNTIVFIDEASMLNTNALKIILESCKRCKIVFIGDPYQLPPVLESKCPAFDIQTKYDVTLHTIQRQINGSSIVHAGEQYRQTIDSNIFPKLVGDNKEIFYLDGPAFRKELDKNFKQYYRSNEEDKLKILAWTNNTVHLYNEHVAKLLKGSCHLTKDDYVVTNKPILYEGSTVYPTDKTLIITGVDRNKTYTSYGVKYYHAEISRIKVNIPLDINEFIRARNKAKKDKDWIRYYEIEDYFADIRFSYASTVHKAQGSTYDKVFINLKDIGRNHNANEVARLLYVAITRASKEVYLYGNLPVKYCK